MTTHKLIASSLGLIGSTSSQFDVVPAPSGSNEPAGMTPWVNADWTQLQLDTGLTQGQFYMGGKMKAGTNSSNLKRRKISQQASWNHAWAPAIPTCPDGDDVLQCDFGVQQQPFTDPDGIFPIGSIRDGEKGFIEIDLPPSVKTLYIRTRLLVMSGYWNQSAGSTKIAYPHGTTQPWVVILGGAGAATSFFNNMVYQAPIATQGKANAGLFAVHEWGLIEWILTHASSGTATDGCAAGYMNGVQKHRRIDLKTGGGFMGTEFLLHYYGGNMTDPTQSHVFPLTWRQYILRGAYYLSYSTTRIVPP